MVKNPLAMQETSSNGGHTGWTLGWGRSLEKTMVTHSSILALGNLMDREAWQAIVHTFVIGRLSNASHSDWYEVVPGPHSSFNFLFL